MLDGPTPTCQTEGWDDPATGAPAAVAGSLHAPRPAWQADRVQPVEINAGTWYLRALRADERVDDRPALAELGEHRPDHVAECAARWESDTLYSWAVCEPTTGELLAEITLDPVIGTVGVRARPGHTQAAEPSTDAVRRFARAMGIPTQPDRVDP